MRNSDYWKQRFEQLEQAQNNMGVRAFRRIERQYEQARREIEGAIARWYQRFAENNSVGMAQARKLLAGSERKELKWEVRDYIRYGRENAIDGRWIKELENASAKFHISRLEALKIQTRQSLEVLFSKQLGTVSSTMGDIFQSSYYHTVYEVQKGFGIGWDIAGLNQDQLETALSKPWAVDGYNFSARVWSDKNRLIHVLHKELTQNLLLGKAPDDAVKTIAKKFGASKSNAGRLVMTESAYFSSVAQRKAFQMLDVEEFEVVGTLDGETCSLCGAMDGKHYPTAQFEAGVTAPPFHPWCRCCTAPYFADNGEYGGARIARKEDGKQYYIPADMTYKDWKSRFVNDEGKDRPQQFPKKQEESKDIFDIDKARRDYARQIWNIPEKYRNKLQKYHEETTYTEHRDIPFSIAYSPKRDEIVYNPLSPVFYVFDFSHINTHELAHRIDQCEIGSWKHKDFISALTEAEKYVTNNMEEIQDYINSHIISPFLSDILNGLSNSELKVTIGHDKEYWQKEDNKAMEIFADLLPTAIWLPKEYELLQKWFPSLTEVFATML